MKSWVFNNILLMYGNWIETSTLPLLVTSTVLLFRGPSPTENFERKIELKSYIHYRLKRFPGWSHNGNALKQLMRKRFKKMLSILRVFLLHGILIAKKRESLENWSSFLTFHLNEYFALRALFYHRNSIRSIRSYFFLHSRPTRQDFIRGRTSYVGMKNGTGKESGKKVKKIRRTFQFEDMYAQPYYFLFLVFNEFQHFSLPTADSSVGYVLYWLWVRSSLFASFSFVSFYKLLEKGIENDWLFERHN